jgi:hypothetical protein
MTANAYYYSEKEWDRLGCGPLPIERDINQLELDLRIPSEFDTSNAKNECKIVIGTL